MTRRRGAAERLRIAVLGYVVRGPLGGLAWHHLQYVMGLRDLGHDVLFIEDSDDYPACYDPVRCAMDTDSAYGLAFAARTFERVGLAERWVYHDAHTGGRWLGPAAASVRAFLADADIVLNLSAVNPLRPWLLSVPTRVLVDTDPVFTQIRHRTDPFARQQAEFHTHYFSFGENIGLPGCTVPDDGIGWKPTRQPIVLDAWNAVVPGPTEGAWSTVMQWESYPARELDGRRFGMKSESFGAIRHLPRQLSDERFELALGSESAPRAALEADGWHLRDPLAVTRDPWTYQSFLASSKGEFSVAKHGYVTSHCGWFSERTAAYLASGRPAVVQETGFSDWLPTGQGVLAYRDADSARAAIETVGADYAAQCRHGRAIAEAYFDSNVVLTSLIERMD